MSAIPPDDPATRAFLRHVLATLAYRAGKTVRDTDASFSEFMAAAGGKSPRAILAHMGDLLDWCLRLVRDGEPRWTTATPQPWPREIERFFAALGSLDAQLASGAPIRWDPGRVFQGGLADALTHTGQLAMLRRLSGNPMAGENYMRADVVEGRVGLEQPAPDPRYVF